MILDLDRQYHEARVESKPGRRWRWEFGVACFTTAGGFALLLVISPGLMRVVERFRDACGDLCLLAARTVAEVAESDAIALRGLALGTMLILATVHAAERLLDRARE